MYLFIKYSCNVYCVALTTCEKHNINIPLTGWVDACPWYNIEDNPTKNKPTIKVPIPKTWCL